MLKVRKLRDLTLTEPGRPYLAAASGLVRVADTLYVIADDEHSLGIFPLAGNLPGRRRPLLLPNASLSADPASRKSVKPDFEVLTHLPAAVFPPHGALLLLGSGSTPRRSRGVLLRLEEPRPAASGRSVAGSMGRGKQQEAPASQPALLAPPDLSPCCLDLSALYNSLASRIPALNLEGAALVGESFLLFQRGNAPGSLNAVIEFAWPEFCDFLTSTAPIPEIRSIRRVDLGDIGGVPFGFTDACPLPDGRIVFTAVAEATSDTYADGPCLGSAVGLLDLTSSGAPDPGPRVSHLVPLDPPYKVEGVHAELAGGQIELLLVADADNPSHPAPLLAASLPDS